MNRKPADPKMQHNGRILISDTWKGKSEPSPQHPSRLGSKVCFWSWVPQMLGKVKIHSRFLIHAHNDVWFLEESIHFLVLLVHQYGKNPRLSMCPSFFEKDKNKRAQQCKEMILLATPVRCRQVEGAVMFSSCDDHELHDSLSFGKPYY